MVIDFVDEQLHSSRFNNFPYQALPSCVQTTNQNVRPAVSVARGGLLMPFGSMVIALTVEPFPIDSMLKAVFNSDTYMEEQLRRLIDISFRVDVVCRIFAHAQSVPSGTDNHYFTAHFPHSLHSTIDNVSTIHQSNIQTIEPVMAKLNTS